MNCVVVEKTPEGYEVQHQGSERVYIYAHVTRALKKVRELLEALGDLDRPAAQLAEAAETRLDSPDGTVHARLEQLPLAAPPDPEDLERRVCCRICSEAQDAAVIHPEQAQCTEKPGDWREKMAERLAEIKAQLADWQNANCRDCRHSDGEQVGTGGQCCLFSGPVAKGPDGRCVVLMAEEGR